ncbi:MAG TPA: hypothetical protein VIR27_02865, partial [Mycobacteriales bacterium]
AAATAAQTASTSTDRGEIGAAYRAALKSDKDAKEAAEKAAQDRQTVEGGTTGMPGGPDGSQQACEQLRQQLWECEQSGWDSSSCQQLANMLEGCQADMTVALVTEDGQLCGSAYLDPDVAQAALDQACGLQISKYGPDADPCGQYVDGVATISHYDGCDPTVAYGGCPSEAGETVELPDKGVLCFEVPSVLPPVPCFQFGGAPDGAPLLSYLVDSAGILSVPGRGGVMAVGGVDPELLPPYLLTP